MKTRQPLLATAGLCAVAVLLDCGIVYALASSSRSFSDRWMTLCGLLVIFATLGGYHLFEGVYPIPREVKFKYSTLCAAMSALAAASMNKIITILWETGGVAKRFSSGASLSEGLAQQVLLAVAIGFGICYYGFGRQEQA